MAHNRQMKENKPTISCNHDFDYPKDSRTPRNQTNNENHRLIHSISIKWKMLTTCKVINI